MIFISLRLQGVNHTSLDNAMKIIYRLQETSVFSIRLFGWALCRLLSKFLLSDNSPLWMCFQQERHQRLDSVQVPCTIWDALRHPAWLPASAPEWQRSYASRCSVIFASPVGIRQISQGTWNDSRFQYAGSWIDLLCLQSPVQHSFPVSGTTESLLRQSERRFSKTEPIFHNFLLALIYECINATLKDFPFSNVQNS